MWIGSPLFEIKWGIHHATENIHHSLKHCASSSSTKVYPVSLSTKVYPVSLSTKVYPVSSSTKVYPVSTSTIGM